MAETLPAALEPELRRIIDTAVARVAAIELDAIREARELTQRSEQEAREALRFALDRAFNLIATLELLAATVGGMAEALKIELDDAIDALRNVPQPESALARELGQTAPAEVAPAPAPAQEAPAPAPAPAPALAHEPDPAPEPEPDHQPASAPEPEAQPAVAEAAPAALEPEKPEAVQPDAVKEEEAEAPAPEAPAPEAPAPEAPAPEAPEPAARGNGYPPAERQAESLAAAGQEQDQQPQRTVLVRGPVGQDGKPAVPARRRGIMRRLFSKQR